MKCKYKCDDFTVYSSYDMADYILSQCSPEDIITTWYNISESMPALYDCVCDFVIGNFCLGDLLFMYRNNILADTMYSWAYDQVWDWLRDEIFQCSMPMLDISVNINSFHIEITWED